MTDPLFRREAIEHRVRRAFGAVRIITPPSHRVYTGLALGFVVVAVLFLTQVEYARRESVRGYLVPELGIQKLFPPHTALVTELLVREGDSVKRDDVLAVLGSGRGSLEVASVDQALSEEAARARTSLQRQVEIDTKTAAREIASLTERAQGVSRRIGQAEAQLATERARLDLARRKQAQIDQLVKDGHASGAQADAQRDALLALQSAVQDLERTLSTLDDERRALRAELDLARLRSDERSEDRDAQMSRAEREALEAAARAQAVLRAPVDGTITLISAQAGQTADARRPLVTLVPEGSALIAHLMVPTRAAGLVQEGDEVVLRYDAFPHQRFGLYRGTVRGVSRTIVQPGELDAPIAFDEAVYLVSVSIDRQSVLAYGQEFPLRAGALLGADIVLERAPLYRWLFDPLLAIGGRL